MFNQKHIKKNIILFGGTFDPVHLGHLILAQEAQNFLSAEKVFFIPCFRSPFKIGQEITHWKHRMKMLTLAIKNNSNFSISDYEIKNKKISYTYNTVEYFSKKYRKYKIYFLMGLDSLLEFKLWKNWDKILENVTIIVGDRLVNKMKRINTLIKMKKIILLNSIKIEISSKEIRNRIKHGMSIKYLVPLDVERYIYRFRIYR